MIEQKRRLAFGDMGLTFQDCHVVAKSLFFCIELSTIWARGPLTGRDLAPELGELKVSRG